MRCGLRMMKVLVGVSCLVGASGCVVSLDDYRNLQAQNRSMSASKEAMAQSLMDARMANDTFRTRTTSIERELATSSELAANLRRENELLEQLRTTAESAMEDMARKQTFGDIAITGPKLPESLHAALKRFADENPSSVVYDSSRGSVKWKSDLLFAVASDVVKATSMASLSAFANIIKSSAGAEFEAIVVGHTDATPIVQASTKAKHPTNWHLSAHRAISVAFVLVKNGYPAQRIGVMGMGEYRPIADNATPSGASQNRRVEIYLMPKGAIMHASAVRASSLDGSALATARDNR